ncbi:hypothetical protein NKG94_00820 [Micromonospora sp. M12]
MFSHLVGRLPDGTAIIGALRDRAPVLGSALSQVLAAASRLPGHHRLRIGPLGLTDVTALIRREAGHDPDDAVARAIHARTAGNPFFVRELSRLLSADGALRETARPHRRGSVHRARRRSRPDGRPRRPHARPAARRRAHRP